MKTFTSNIHKLAKTFLFVTFLIIASLLLIGCSKKENVPVSNNPESIYESASHATQEPSDITRPPHSAVTEEQPDPIQSEQSTEPVTEPVDTDWIYEDGTVCLNVENIMQMPLLPNGCEITSLAIVLNYMGYDIDHYTLYSDYLTRSPYQDGNPWIEYIGEATDYGLGCYAPCIADAGNTYLSMLESEHRVKDVSYQNLEDYKKYIDEGKPVIIWGMLDMLYDPTLAWWTYIDGQEVVWHANSHCLVMIGYTEDEYIFCDPLVGIAYYNKYAVMDCFYAMYEQACIIE